MTQPNTDTLYILRGSGIATKQHKRTIGLGWETLGYDNGAYYTDEAHTVGSLAELLPVLKHAARDPRKLLIHEAVRESAQGRRFRRKFPEDEKQNGVNAGRLVDQGQGAEVGLIEHPTGQHWVMFDADGFTAPDWYDPTDPSLDQPLARWWVNTHLPAEFSGRSFILQWSGSSGVKPWPWMGFHLFFWMDKPVARGAWEKHAKSAWKHKPGGLDFCIWDRGRVHYIADPLFRHIDGSRMDDPLSGRRWQWVQGELGDAVPALPWMVDGPTWAARVQAAAAAKAAKKLADAQAASSLDKAVLAASTLRVARAFAPRLNSLDGAQCATEDMAWEVVSRAVAEARGCRGAGMHDAVRRITKRVASRCGSVLGFDDIYNALEEACVGALMRGESARSTEVARLEFERLLRGAFAAGFDAPPSSTPTFASIGAASILAAADDDPLISPLALDGDGVELVVERTVEDLIADWSITISDGRAELGAVIREAVAVGGRWAVKAPAGLGKSHAICEALVSHRKTKRLGTTSPSIIAAPDLALAREVCEGLRARGANAVVAVTRTEKNCERFIELTAAQRLAPEGGKRLCESCQWHPRNAGSADACPFWKAFSAQSKADFVCQSHTLLALQGATSARLDGDVDTVPVRIDWQSFNDFGPGLRAVPRVRRTAAELVISAQISHEPEATTPPAPQWSDTPRWTAEAKRGLIEWIAKAWGCEPTRRAVMDHVAPKADVVFFDWTSIGQLAGESGSFRPLHYRESQGWLKGHHVGVERVQEGGAELPLITFTDTFPILAESKSKIREWIRGVWGVATDFDLDTYARLNIDDYPVDTLVIDESILHAMRTEGSLTRADLQELALAGEIAGPGVEELIRVMYQSEQQWTEGWAKGKRGAGRVAGEALRALAPLSVTSRHAVAEARLIEALRLDDDTARLTHLQGGWGWEAVEALRFAALNDWTGAYIARGTLFVAAPRALKVAGVRSVVLLDATATQAQAQATLGADVQWRDIAVAANPFCEVVHVPVDLGPQAAAWGTAAGPGSRRNAAHFVAALKRWGGESTVTFAHKRCLDAERSWIAPLLADPAFGDVTYHGAAQSRGSNRWRQRETCIVTSHHVPGAAKRQHAELLAHMCGEVYASDADRWDVEASWLLEAAPVIQELARIRPLDATPSTPKRLVVLDQRVPEAFGLLTTHVIDPDLLAWEELRFLPALTDDAQGRLRYPVMQAVVADTLARVGGCLPLGGFGAGFGGVEVADFSHSPSSLACLQDIESAPSLQSMSNRLNTWMRKRFRTPAHFAHAMGCEVAEVNVWGRQPVAFLAPAGARLTAAQVEPYLAQLGIRDYRLGSGPWQTIGVLESATLPLSRALFALPRARVEEATMMGLYGYAAACCGVSSKTIQRWVAKAALEGEDARACLVRLWHGAHALMVAATAAEQQALGVDVEEGARAYVAETMAQVWELRHVAARITDDELVDDPQRRDHVPS